MFEGAIRYSALQLLTGRPQPVPSPSICLPILPSPSHTLHPNRGQFQALQAMLLRHRGAIAPLNSSERSLLREQVAALEAALQPGLSRINWTSLTIPGFVAAVNKVGAMCVCGSGLLVSASPARSTPPPYDLSVNHPACLLSQPGN